MTKITSPFVQALYPLVSRVRTDITALKSNGKTRWTKDPLTYARLLEHVEGKASRGVCPIKAGETTTMVAVLDLDSHKGETPWEEMTAACQEITEELERRSLKPIPFRSSGGKGIHLYLIWDEPQDAYSVRNILYHALNTIGYESGARGVAQKQVEIFPKQNAVEVGKFGNQFILPLAGSSEPLNPLDGLRPAGRDHALLMSWPISSPVPISEKPVLSVSNREAGEYRNNLAAIAGALKYISPDIHHDDWIKVGMAIHFESGQSAEGLNLWDDWSVGLFAPAKCSEKYSGRDELERRWNTFRTDKSKTVGIGSIRNLARLNGWSDVSRIVFENIDEIEGLTKSNRFKVKSAAEFASGTPPEWIIKRILPKTGLGMIYGESGSGKSFLALDMIAAIARGQEWRGRKVKRGKVVYVAAEGISGMRNRLKAYALHHDIDLQELAIGIIDDTPDLRKDDYQLLAAQIQAAGGASVIVIDTLAQATPGANENTSEDMGLAIDKCQRLQVKTDALILLIHHTGKDRAKGARGWSGLKGALDVQIEVFADAKRKTRVAQVTKQKDGESDIRMDFQIEQIFIDLDEDYESITSCVVIHSGSDQEGSQKRSSSRDDRPSGKWQILVMDAIEVLELTVDVTAASVINYLKNGKLKAPEYSNSQNRHRDNIHRALASLHATNHIIMRDKVISLPSHTPTNPTN